MAEPREQTRRERAEARQRRRSLLTQPFEAIDEKSESAARSVGLGDDRQVSPAAKTAVAATAAALAGGLAGAAKAAIERRRQQEDEPEAPEGSTAAPPDEHEHEHEEAEPAPEAEADAGDGQEDEAREPTANAEDEDAAGAGDDAPEQVEAAGAGADADGEREEEADDEPRAQERESSDGAGDEAPAGDLRRVIESARRQLKELVGTEVETVSSLERTDDGWRVTLEAVELRRVPDSTDVLCSYEVVLGGDACSVVSLERTRRYRRAQVDGE